MTYRVLIEQFLAEVAGQEGVLPLLAAIARLRDRAAALAREGEGGTR